MKCHGKGQRPRVNVEYWRVEVAQEYQLNALRNKTVMENGFLQELDIEERQGEGQNVYVNVERQRLKILCAKIIMDLQ